MSGRGLLVATAIVLTFIIPVFEAFAMDVTPPTLESNFETGSGFPDIGRIGTIVGPVALALVIFWAVWGIISEVRAVSAGNGDSWSLGGAVIRAAILPILLATLIAVLS